MPGKITATIEARDLQAIDNVIYEPKQEELTARSVFPQKFDVNEGAESYSFDVMTRSGVAKIIANGADDLPLVDVDMVRKSVPIYSIGIGLSYTVQDLRACSYARNYSRCLQKRQQFVEQLQKKKTLLLLEEKRNMQSKGHLKLQAFRLMYLRQPE
ncbi:major capsid family protein [Listeria monocytogenes]|uniref:major capsid family protein n=1 Tax=Listeria monocytogenes TaxID=1639 RepID=UPI003B42AEC7